MRPGYLLMLTCFPCFFNPPEVRGERKLYTLLFLPALAAIPTFRKKIYLALDPRPDRGRPSAPTSPSQHHGPSLPLNLACEGSAARPSVPRPQALRSSPCQVRSSL